VRRQQSHFMQIARAPAWAAHVFTAKNATRDRTESRPGRSESLSQVQKVFIFAGRLLMRL